MESGLLYAGLNVISAAAQTYLIYAGMAAGGFLAALLLCALIARGRKRRARKVAAKEGGALSAAALVEVEAAVARALQKERGSGGGAREIHIHVGHPAAGHAAPAVTEHAAQGNTAGRQPYAQANPYAAERPPQEKNDLFI